MIILIKCENTDDFRLRDLGNFITTTISKSCQVFKTEFIQLLHSVKIVDLIFTWIVRFWFEALNLAQL